MPNAASWVIAVILIIHLLLALYSLRMNGKTGSVWIKGYSRASFFPFYVLSFVSTMYVLIQAKGYFKWVLLILLVYLDYLIRTVRLGEHGLKVNLRFYPRSRLLGYQMAEDSLTEAEMFIADRPNPVKLSLGRKQTDLENKLQMYFQE